MENKILSILLTGFVSFIIGYAIGQTDGKTMIYKQYHVQATAGIFIDGYDKSTIYDLTKRTK